MDFIGPARGEQVDIWRSSERGSMMQRPATADELARIQFLVARGYVVEGFGYQYSMSDGLLNIERIESAV